MTAPTKPPTAPATIIGIVSLTPKNELAMKAPKIAGKKLVFAPILRAGLGMVQPFTDLFPDVSVGYVGLERDHATAAAHSYYCKLPPLAGCRVFVVDPMLATGGSASYAATVCKARGSREVKLLSLIAAPEGVERMQTDHPDVDLHVAALDECLNEVGYIVPGLGDAGDRMFGTK